MRKLRILRREGATEPRRWELFDLPAHPDVVTVADALHVLAGNVGWDSRCVWPSCGVCTMVIAGRAADACATRLHDAFPKRGPLSLQPLAGFPVVRDLWVDRSRLTTDASRLGAWGDARTADPFASCTRCGACLDACPEVRGGKLDFVGAAPIALSHAARRDHPDDRERLDALTDARGIHRCGLAGACEAACPEALPLREALANAAGMASRHALRRLFGR
jgi:succinate dehydrogenase/fumarate reductase-like Fe-S protein